MPDLPSLRRDPPTGLIAGAAIAVLALTGWLYLRAAQPEVDRRTRDRLAPRGKGGAA
jgi:hypothetical protein